MSELHKNKSWEAISKNILDYLNVKIPDVPEVTRQEIAVHFSSTMAITLYDAYEGWARDFTKASRLRRPLYRDTHLTEEENE